jgi:hypothetical protein
MPFLPIIGLVVVASVVTTGIIHCCGGLRSRETPITNEEIAEAWSEMY